MMSNHDNVKSTTAFQVDLEPSLNPFPELGTGYGSHYLTTPDDGLILLDTKSVKIRGQWSVARIGGLVWYRRWLVNRWHVLNELMFGSQMKEPTDLVIGSRTTVLGTWSPWKRQLLVSAVCFSHKTEEHALGTLAHEMAHQYESEHSPRPYGEDAHGQMWKNIMLSIGFSDRSKFYGRFQAPTKNLSLAPTGTQELVFGPDGKHVTIETGRRNHQDPIVEWSTTVNRADY